MRDSQTTRSGEELRSPVSHALCVYAEPLVRGRRVVVVGDATDGVGERLVELGARAVHVYDPDGARASSAAASRGLVVRALPPGEFDVRDGAFDVAIVPDLGAVDARGDLLARLRRLIGRAGAALIGGGAGGERTIDYYELYDRAALQFSCVRMIAGLPFEGVVLADLGLEGSAPEVSVETQLAGDPGPPQRFFALASQDEVRLADYAIVQLPPAATADEEESIAGSEPGYGEAPAQAALAEAQLRASLLEAQIDELRAKAARGSANQDQADRIAELEARLADVSGRLGDAERRAVEHYERADRFSNEAQSVATQLVRERERSQALEEALGGAEGALSALRARTSGTEERLSARETELAVALADLDAAREAARLGEAQLEKAAAAEARAASLMAEVSLVSEEHAAELGRLEESLRGRARAVRELEQEVLRREGIVRELLASLDEARSESIPLAEAGSRRDAELSALEVGDLRRDVEAREEALRAASEEAARVAREGDELRARLDAASMDLARKESEREELAWRVAELEGHISRLEAEQTELTLTLPPPPMGRATAHSQVDTQVDTLQNELDILRQAMAQEHAARVRAESGEELEKARSELARQATLLEQLSRELEARDRARAAEGRSVDRTEA